MSITASEPVTSAAARHSLDVAIVVGMVHGNVVVGATHDGVELTSFDVSVFDEDGRWLVPVTVRARACPVLSGEEVAIRGRVVKRFHRAGAATVARTSVEATEVLRSPRPAALQRFLDRATRTAKADAPARGRRPR